jgi:drug/metabolite transporter (DMT)-like permease
VLGNLLIAAGTLVLSASGTLAGRLGKDRAFAVTLLVGIVVLFAGFLVASAPAPRAALHAVPRADDDDDVVVATPARRASTSR